MQDLSVPLCYFDSAISATSSYYPTKESNVIDLTNDVEGTDPSNDTTNTTNDYEGAASLKDSTRTTNANSAIRESDDAHSNHVNNINYNKDQ